MERPLRSKASRLDSILQNEYKPRDFPFVTYKRQVRARLKRQSHAEQCFGSCKEQTCGTGQSEGSGHYEDGSEDGQETILDFLDRDADVGPSASKEVLARFCEGITVEDLRRSSGLVNASSRGWVQVDSRNEDERPRTLIETCPRKLCELLGDQRFDSQSSTATDRRLVVIENVSPYYAMALAETATIHERGVLINALFHYLTNRPQVELTLSRVASAFAFSFNLPMVVLRQLEKPPSADWESLNLPLQTVRNGTLMLRHVTTSISICGRSNKQWLMYAFRTVLPEVLEDLHGEGEDNDYDCGDDTRSVWPGMFWDVNSFDREEQALTDVREYALRALLAMVRSLENETSWLHFCLEEQIAPCLIEDCESSSYTGGSSAQPHSAWIHVKEILPVLQRVRIRLQASIEELDRFLGACGDSKSCDFGNKELLFYITEQIQDYMRLLRASYKRITSLHERCVTRSKQMKFDLVLEQMKSVKSIGESTDFTAQATLDSQRITSFTLWVLAPMALAAALLAMPEAAIPIPVTPFTPLLLFVAICVFEAIAVMSASLLMHKKVAYPSNGDIVPFFWRALASVSKTVDRGLSSSTWDNVSTYLQNMNMPRSRTDWTMRLPDDEAQNFMLHASDDMFDAESSAVRTIPAELQGPSWSDDLRSLAFSLSVYDEGPTFNVQTRDLLRRTFADLEDVDVSTITISLAYKATWLESLQRRLERATHCSWDWWPLSRPRHDLPDGCAQLTWTCNCGETRWAQIPSIIASKLLELVGLEKRRLHDTEAGATELSSPPPSMSTDSEETLEGATEAIAFKDRYIFLLVKSSGHLWRLAQIEAAGLCDDTLFAALKKHYIAKRGLWRYVFSPWGYAGCAFVQVEKIEAFAHEVIARGTPEKTDQDYEYELFEEDPKQPISRHTFNHYFRHCWRGKRKHRHYFSLQWNCCEEPRQKTKHLARIPKRKTRVDDAGEGGDTYWALRADEELKVFRVAIYHILALTSPLIFSCLWLKKYPKDLQGAAVPITLSLALLATFWTMVRRSR